jgi:hypothetical protein
VLAAGSATLARRTAPTVTVAVEEVRVLFVAELLSVAIAVSEKLPGAEGVHTVENGAVVAIPTETPLTRKSTLVMDAVPLLAVAFAVNVTVFEGEARTPRLAPLVGEVIETESGGAAMSPSGRTRAHAAAKRRRNEAAGGAEIALGTTRSASEQRWFMGGAPG